MLIIFSLGGAGVVSVVFGTPSGLSATNNKLVHMDAGSQQCAKFGASLAVSQFGGDSSIDPAVGIPKWNVATSLDGGAVSIRYGSATGPSATTSNEFWTAGILEPQANFGFAHRFVSNASSRRARRKHARPTRPAAMSESVEGAGSAVASGWDTATLKTVLCSIGRKQSESEAIGGRDGRVQQKHPAHRESYKNDSIFHSLCSFSSNPIPELTRNSLRQRELVAGAQHIFHAAVFGNGKSGDPLGHIQEQAHCH